MEDSEVLPIQISPQLLKAIANAYKNPYRVFIEFIDNSIDQADRLFLDMDSNSYTKEIIIRVTQSGRTYKNAKVTFEDNCGGMEWLIEESIYKHGYAIGNSVKAEEEISNGKFGFGMMSFLYLCKSLNVSTRGKLNMNNPKSSEVVSKMSIDEVSLNKPGLNHVPIKISIEDYKGDPKNTFTIVELSDFKKEKFRDINLEKLKSEVELHFEGILRRRNIKIIIVSESGKEYICQPFNYNEFGSAFFERTLTDLKYMYNKKKRTERTISIAPNQVKVFLAVTKDKILDRRPFFIIKDRRIEVITRFEEFRSEQKLLGFSHPNLIGYVSVTGVVEPTLTRDSFETGEYLKPLFYTLKKLEPEVQEFIKKELNIINKSAPNKIEEKLNDAFKEFINSMKRNYDKKNESKEQKKSSKKTIEEMEERNFTLFDNKGNPISMESSSIPSQTKKTYGTGTKGKSSSSTQPMGYTNHVAIEIPVKNKIDDTEAIDLSSLVSIRFDKDSEPEVDENNSPYRSKFTGTEIIIYQKHKSFQEKLKGHSISPVVTSELLTYIAAEVITHFYANLLDEIVSTVVSKEKIYAEFISMVYAFEGFLNGLVGTTL